MFGAAEHYGFASSRLCARLVAPLQWSCGGTVAGVPFTRQGSQVRTLYHPPVISQLNQALTRNRSAFFTSKSSINTPYYYSYVSALVLLGFAGGDAGCSVSVVNGADKLIASEKKRSSHSERDLEQLLA